MPEDMGAVGLESAEISSGAEEAVETSSSASPESTEVTETSNQSDSPVEKDVLTEKTPAKSRPDLAKIAKVSSEALKAIDPALPAALRTAAFELGSLYREFPGGLKEAVQVKQALGEIGGIEGIKETQEAISDYVALESLFEKGDAQFIERLADALPSSFSQIMPAGLEKWKQADPEMYNHVQARVMIQTLDSARVSDTLEAVWRQLDGEKQGPLKDAIAQIWQTLDGYRQAGAKAPERKIDPQAEALTKREQELAAREVKAMLSPIANEGRRQIETITDREMNASYRWNETDSDIKSAVGERIRLEVVRASKKDPSFNREWERLKERGDSAGLQRHLKNFQEKVTPAIVQRVARLFAVKPKNAGPAVVKKPVAQVTANGKAPERGWEKISAQPSAAQMDRAKTTADMILDNKAILKDGRKVAWA